MPTYPNSWDFDNLNKIEWVPQYIKDEIQAGGWDTIQKYRIKINYWTIPPKWIDNPDLEFTGIVPKKPDSYGQQFITIVPWNPQTALTQHDNVIKEWMFIVPDPDDAGKTPEEGEQPKSEPSPAEGGILVDPKCKNAPESPDEPPITQGDISPAIMAFQTWAIENVPSIKFQIDGKNGEGDPHGTMKWTLGVLDFVTRGELQLWQKEHVPEIKKAGGHEGDSEEDKQWWEKEKGEIGYATWKILNAVMGATPAKCGDVPATTTEPPAPTPETDPEAAPTPAASTTLATHRMPYRWKIVQTNIEGPPALHKRGHIVRSQPTSSGIVGYLPNDQPYVVVEDEFLGPRKLFSRIKVVNAEGTGFMTDWLKPKHEQYEGPYYVRSKHCEPLPGTPKSLNIVAPAKGGSGTTAEKHRAHPFPVDWTKLEPSNGYGYFCYLDLKTEEYKIRLGAPRFRTEATEGEGEFYELEDYEANADKRKILTFGVRMLLEYYDKAYDDDDVLKLVDAHKGPYIPPGTKGLYQPDRPDSPIDVLICFPAKYFDAIPDNRYSVEDLQDDFTSERSIHFQCSTLNDRVAYLDREIRKHARILSKQGLFLAVTKDEMPAAAKILAAFPSLLREFLTLNGISDEVLKSREVTVEIGLDNDFDIDYVLLNQTDDEQYPAMVGIEAFVDKLQPDLGSDGQTAMHYFYAMQSLIPEAQSPSLSSVDFVHKYHYPAATLKPSETPPKAEDTTPSPKKTTAGDDAAVEPAKAAQELQDEKLKAPSGEGKTKGERQDEDAKMNDPERKTKVYRHRERAFDFTGDNIVADLVWLSQNVNSLDDLFGHVLNKTNVKQLGEIALSAMMCNLSNDDKQRLMLEKAIDRAGKDTIAMIWETLVEEHLETAKKVYEELMKDRRELQEQIGKFLCAGEVPDTLKDKAGNVSEILVQKAADAMSETEAITSGLSGKKSSPPGSGGDIASKLPPEIKKVVQAASSTAPPEAALHTPPPPPLEPPASPKWTDPTDQAKNDAMHAQYKKDMAAYWKALKAQEVAQPKEKETGTDASGQAAEDNKQKEDAAQSVAATSKPLSEEIASDPSCTDLSGWGSGSDSSGGKSSWGWGSGGSFGWDSGDWSGWGSDGSGTGAGGWGFGSWDWDWNFKFGQLTTSDLKWCLGKISGDALGLFSLGRLSFQKIIWGFLPDWELQLSLQGFGLKLEGFGDWGGGASGWGSGDWGSSDWGSGDWGVGDWGFSLPTISIPDNWGTVDPMPGIEQTISEGVASALTEVLLGLFTQVISQIKKAMDNDCSDKHGAMEGMIPDAAAEDAFGKAGIPTGLAPDFMKCLSQRLTIVEMEDLLHGIMSDEVKVVIKLCAAKITGLEEHMGNLPRAFANLKDVIDPNIFVDAEDQLDDAPPDNSSGLLCDDEDSAGLGKYEDLGVLERQNRDRTRDLAKRISDIIDDTDSLLPVLPPILSDCGEAGIIPRDPPAMAEMNNMVIDAIFMGAKMAFSDDAASFADAMILKENRSAQSGDHDWIPESGAGVGIDPATGQKFEPEVAKRKNQQNQKIRQTVGGRLKEDLKKSENFTFLGWQQTSLNMRAHVLPSSEEVLLEGLSELQALSSIVAQRQKELGDLQELKAALPAGGPGSFTQGVGSSYILEQKIATAQSALTSAQDARDTAAKLQANPEGKGADVQSSESTIKIKRVIKKNIKYEIPWAPDEYSGLRDKYKVSFTKETQPPQGTLSGHLVEKDHAPQTNLEETDSYDYSAGQGTYQSEAFANYIIKRFTDAGFINNQDGTDWISSPKNKAGYDALTKIYQKTFQSLLRQAARQAAQSPIFNLNTYAKLDFSSEAEILDSGNCAPNEISAGVDILGLAKIKDNVLDEYEESCESVDPESETTTALENSARHGVVKTFTRLFMAEILMKSVFIFAEYKASDMLQDNLIVEYALNVFYEKMADYDLALHADIVADAGDMINKRLKTGAELENFYNLNDMDVLKGAAGSVPEQEEAALKYLALEQFADLVDKFDNAVGYRTESIHRRFINPPQNSGTELHSESTEAGMPVQIPDQSDAGWIRTIDVAKARVTALGDVRFLGVFTPLTHETTNVGYAGVFGGGTQTITGKGLSLKYPDLTKTAGTFFLERYIRVEDKTELEPSATSALGVDGTALIRKRIGGPDGPTSGLVPRSGGSSGLPSNHLKPTAPHLSGVVNIQAWQEYIDNLEISPTAKVADCFKPWKYGLRLVYIPPMQEGAQTLIDAKYLMGFHGWQDVPKIKTAIGEQLHIFDDGLAILENIAAKGQNENLQSFGAGAIEKNLNLFFASNDFSKAETEKAFFLEEREETQFAFTGKFNLTDHANMDHGLTDTQNSGKAISQFKRPVFVIPLCSVEKEINIENIKDFNSNAVHQFDSSTLRASLVETDKYKFLFNYVFPLPRMLSLLTIYSANATALSMPETDKVFGITRGVLRNLYYSLSSSSNADQVIQEIDPAGNKIKFDATSSNKGPSIDYAGIALRTIPYIIRGWADYTDPHYKLVSRLVDYQILPTGKTWSSVPIFWPVNFPFGWGPPLTGIGMLAYSMPQLPGDKKSTLAAQFAAGEGISTEEEDCE